MKMISYADIERAYRLERTSSLLQKLPDDFYADAKKLSVSPDIGEHGDAVIENLVKIYQLRVNKIIHYAGRATPENRPPENALSEETSLYRKIMDAVSENKANVLDKKVELKVEESKPMLKVRMKQALPAIVGSDSREYGPFRADDVVELPEDSAKLLINKDAAEKA